MSGREHYTDYDEETTARCERVLVTLLGDLGPWRERMAAASPVAKHEQVDAALTLLEERFRDAGQDGPSAYALFLAEPDDEENSARLRQEALATVREFLAGFRDAG